MSEPKTENKTKAKKPSAKKKSTPKKTEAKAVAPKKSGVKKTEVSKPAVKSAAAEKPVSKKKAAPKKKVQAPKEASVKSVKKPKRPRTIKKLTVEPRSWLILRNAFFVVCAVLAAGDLVLNRHGYHPWEGVPGFYVVFGVVSCVVLVFGGRVLRFFVMRDEAYYQKDPQKEDQRP